MSGGERAQVGQALDALRVALSAYVDAAMVAANGDRWDDVVAGEDAKRRTNGRKYPVRKNDLAVMLKVLIHRRIEPWVSLREYQRLRAFASEILTLRNLHAHGDDCADEYSRLIDTAGRMLTLLSIPVPQELQTSRLELARIPGGEGSVHLSAQQPSINRLDAEIAHLGEAGQQVATIFSKASQLDQTLSSYIHDELAALDPVAPDFDTFKSRLGPRMVSAGEEAIGLLADLERVQLAGTEPKDPLLALLFLLARRELTSQTAIEAYRIDLLAQSNAAVHRDADRYFESLEVLESENPREWDPREDPDYRSIDDRLAEVDRLVGAMGSDDFSRAIRHVASQLGEASWFGNMALGIASMDEARASKDEQGHWTAQALPHLRDAISRLRFDAGMEPGTGTESMLVTVLRAEGEAYNDVGQPEDALQSFARAAEIVDRYPSADPSLLA